MNVVRALLTLMLALSASSLLADPYPQMGNAMVNGQITPCYLLPNKIVCSSTPPTEETAVGNMIEAITLHGSAKYGAGALLLLVALFYVLSGINIVDQWERKPLTRWGKYIGTLEGGVYWREPFSTKVIDTISVRDKIEDIYTELDFANLPTVQTHDNVPVSFGVLITYRVIDAMKFVLNVENDYESLWNRSNTITSEFIGNTELDSILHDRQSLYAKILAALQAAVQEWGIQMIAVELRNVKIADEGIQEAISQKARAQKEGEAELTRAKAQLAIAQQLEEAAAVYTDASWKLKGLDLLGDLCRTGNNNTIVIPSDLVQGLAKVIGKPDSI